MQPSSVESRPESTVAPAEEPPAEEDLGQEAGCDDDESNEALIFKAQALMDRITANPENPNPNTLHALSSILEFEESSYIKDVSCPSSNGRSTHNIGRLGNLIRENDEFFELISSTFLSERRYSVSVQAAATRLLFSCSLTFMYPHVFEETVLDNLKSWVMEETSKSGDDHYWRHESLEWQSSESEMLKTFSTGLLAVCLASGSQVAEDVLTPGLPAKLMRYLRIRVLGETHIAQRDSPCLADSKTASTSIRTREEGRGRLRQVPECSYLDVPILSKDGLHDDQLTERDRDRITSRCTLGDEHWNDEEPPDMIPVNINSNDVEAEGEDKWHIRDLRDGKTKLSSRSIREEDVDETATEVSVRRRASRGSARSRVWGRATEGVMENGQALTSPSSGNRLGGHARSRNLTRNIDGRKINESKQNIEKNPSDGFGIERDENDDCFQECKIGSKDITDLVKKAVGAAEAEAKAVNAPTDAIRAAGDAAAEVVKSAALEEFKKENNEEAAIVAASRAASTVVDAAIAVEIARNVTSIKDPQDPKLTEKNSEEVDEFFVLDSLSLAKLREKFCIQCLAILGEYVEVLGPVLHEKGVDVCLALLQRNSKDKDGPEVSLLLPDVLKLIWSLAAHRKFAAVFVDRGGIQKLLAVPRVPQTFFGLSSCLFTIGSIQGIMERVCALPSNIVHQAVELVLHLLECSNDQAKKNAALFFAAAFVFRAILDTFDAQDGLQKMLSLLQDAASVRSGTSGTIAASGSLRSERSPPEVLTSSEKQIAYHTCVALRQYFRAHLILIVDLFRPNKNVRGAARNIPSVRAAYKPLDISNEAMDVVFRQIQKDRKLGSALVKARWSVVDKFLSSNGHITMLEFCQAAPPVERYLHDLLQYALGVLHIVTLVPNSRKLIVNTTLSNDRLGVAVILDAANGAGYVEPEIIEAALNVLINLVCPPPSISNKPPVSSQGQQNAPILHSNSSNIENRDRTVDRAVQSLITHNQSDPRERNGESALVDRGNLTAGTTANSTTQGPHSAVPSGLVGDRRISLGAGAGCAGLAAQLEQCYYQAREAVRANNGIKVLLQLLQPRIVTPPASLDCLRALACRVLLGLARDDTIAHILTKLQVGKKLSELIRDLGNQNSGTEQSKWQSELAQVAIELIGVVTSSGRASTLAASDAATPTLRRIERAAIAAATPISYHARELLLLVHEHLQASGLTETASTLLKEAQLMPLPSLSAPSSLTYQISGQETSSLQQTHWPSGRAPGGFMLDNKPKAATTALQDEEFGMKCDTAASSKKKPLVFSSGGRSGLHSKYNNPSEISPVCKINNSLKPSTPIIAPLSMEGQPAYVAGNVDMQSKTPTALMPGKRKSTDSGSVGAPPVKRLNSGETLFKSLPTFGTPNNGRRSGFPSDAPLLLLTPPPSSPCVKDQQQHGRSVGSALPVAAADGGDINLLNDMQASSSSNTERLTLDSLVVQFLKHQHRQCPAPITTLPPLSLLQPHVCPEPKRSLDAPSNVTSRLTSREFRSMYSGGIHGRHKDRQFVYSRFRPWRTCRDDAGALLTCMTFLGDSQQIAAGSHLGELKIFDSNSNTVLESFASHQNPVTQLQSYLSGENPQLMLSSSSQDVQLWDVSSVSAGPRHSFEGCKAPRFSSTGTTFAALSTDSPQREILLYDIQTCQLESKLTDNMSTVTSGRGNMYPLVHFGPSDDRLLWNGVLWDRRQSRLIHRFDELTDFGGGGFHPSRNEVIINSEVWDLRKFRLLRNVPSLHHTMITFNGSGDVIYAILRRNLEDVTSAFNNWRAKHPLFSAFRTVDSNYGDIATIHVDRCVLDFAMEPTDSFVGLVTMDDQDEMYSSARVYEIGRQRLTEDDSDPDDADSEEGEDDEDDDDDDEEVILATDLDGDGESDGDDVSLGGLGDEDEDDDDDGGFIMGYEGEDGMLEIVTEGEDDDSELMESFGSEDEDDFL